MFKASRYHFYPEEIFKIGFLVLGSGVLLTFSPWIASYFEAPVQRLALPKEVMQHRDPLSFSLGLQENQPILPTPDLQGELTFSVDPPRPIGEVQDQRVLLRLKKHLGSMRVMLPCRIDLEFRDNCLAFASQPSSFWVDLSLEDGDQIRVDSYLLSLDRKVIHAGSFVAEKRESPILAAGELAENSPFRSLAEAKWFGADLLLDKKSSGERFEIKGSGVELNKDEWLVWKNHQWEKSDKAFVDLPIARIQSIANQSVVFEGWDLDGHVRFTLPSSIGAPFKMRPEDLLSSIRVRSEKQISCMLEKQCMVLKTGDWVLKTNNKWKILRKKTEREDFVNGKLAGELFVFEQIAVKHGQKIVQGKIYNIGRTQMVPVEIAAQKGRKLAKKGTAR